MAHIVVIGAGLGGLPTAYELRHLLPRQHTVTLISDSPKFTFIPSLPWVALDLISLDRIQQPIEAVVTGQGIQWIEGLVTKLDPIAQQLLVGQRQINYDYVVIATGANLALDAVPGLGPENGYTPNAAAAIRQLEEAPGQVVYQSRQTLKDQHGNSWQAIAFKRILADGKTSFNLRLVGFPGLDEIDHSQPLTLTNSLGKTLSAADASSKIFTETTKSEPNVAQYDLQPLLPQLLAEIPWKLKLSTSTGEAISLSIPTSLVQEWQTVADYE